MYNNVKAITPTTRLKIFIEYNPSCTLISPTIVSSPKMPPLIFPASYEAFPTTIADKMSSIEERVKKIVCEQLGVKEDEVKPSASFVEDLGADSLDTVELVMALEEEFETEIPDEEAEKITTVQLATDYINSHL